MIDQPHISVVTVVFNDETEIEATIQSVLDQSYPKIELIVIDGKSTDGTLKKLDAFRPKIDHFLSESDQGIYDAMNKGISLASGEWIYFLNAGDQFMQSDTLNEIAEQLQLDGPDLVYGKHLADYGYFERIHRPGPLDQLKYGMVFSHQALFVRTELLKSQAFDLTYQLAADFDFIYRQYQENKKFKEVETIIASLKAEGVSERQISKTHAERKKIVCSYESGWTKFQLSWWYFRKAVHLRIVQIAKFILPEKTKQRLTKRKYGQ